MYKIITYYIILYFVLFFICIRLFALDYMPNELKSFNTGAGK
jgi:hypothetical protein